MAASHGRQKILSILYQHVWLGSGLLRGGRGRWGRSTSARRANRAARHNIIMVYHVTRSGKIVSHSGGWDSLLIITDISHARRKYNRRRRGPWLHNLTLIVRPGAWRCASGRQTFEGAHWKDRLSGRCDQRRTAVRAGNELFVACVGAGCMPVSLMDSCKEELRKVFFFKATQTYWNRCGRWKSRVLWKNRSLYSGEMVVLNKK